MVFSCAQACPLRTVAARALCSLLDSACVAAGGCAPRQALACAGQGYPAQAAAQAAASHARPQRAR